MGYGGGNLHAELCFLANFKTQLILSCFTVGVAKVQLQHRVSHFLKAPSIRYPVFQLAGADAGDGNYLVLSGNGQNLQCRCFVGIHGDHGTAAGEKIVVVRYACARTHWSFIHVANVEHCDSFVLQGGSIRDGLCYDATDSRFGKTFKAFCSASDIRGSHHDGVFEIYAAKFGVQFIAQ